MCFFDGLLSCDGMGKDAKPTGGFHFANGILDVVGMNVYATAGILDQKSMIAQL